MNYTKYITAVLCTLLMHNAHAKMVEFIENSYLVQAPSNITTIADEAAQITGFTKNYEIAIPKKAGLQVNPWNRLISSAPLNPQTQLPYIIVNPSWFLTLPKNQQTFLLARCFTALEQGLIPLSIKMAPWAFSLLFIALIILFFWLLGKTALGSHKGWIRLIVAYLIAAGCNVTVMNKLQTTLINYLAVGHDKAIIQATLDKTKDPDAAIKALEAMDTTIKNQLQEGETFWTPFSTVFEPYIKALKENK